MASRESLHLTLTETSFLLDFQEHYEVHSQVLSFTDALVLSASKKGYTLIDLCKRNLSTVRILTSR